jgi:hypothetical protein
MAKLNRVGPDHPRVCQGNTGTGPCCYEAMPGASFCGLHGGGNAAAGQARKELRNYKLNSIYAERTQELGSSPNIKNLSDEIALLRVSLEVIFNSIKSENEMLLYVDKIEKLTKGIQGLLETLQRLQEKNKELLGRDTVVQIFDALMEKICERVQDPDIILALAEDGHGIIARGLSG